MMDAWKDEIVRLQELANELTKQRNDFASKLDALEKRMADERIAFGEELEDRRKAIENREARLKAAETRLGRAFELIRDMREWHARMAYSDVDTHEARWAELINRAAELERVVERQERYPGLWVCSRCSKAKSAIETECCGLPRVSDRTGH